MCKLIFLQFPVDFEFRFLGFLHKYEFALLGFLLEYELPFLSSNPSGVSFLITLEFRLLPLRFNDGHPDVVRTSRHISELRLIAAD